MKLKFVILFLFFVSSANAIQYPRSMGKEKRFKTYVYNPNDVYSFTAFYYNQTYIEFEQGETIQSVALGDAIPWLSQVVGNKLFLKPIGDYPQTSMTIFTDKRVYYFELDALYPDEVEPDEITFYIKFMYPTSGENKNIVKFNVTEKRSDYPDLNDLSKYNFNYEFVGSPNIAPVKVFDDGIFTYMEFRSENAEIPAIFSVNESGYESLVNFRVVEEYIVIEEIVGQFTLRSGSNIVCVYNNALYKFR